MQRVVFLFSQRMIFRLPDQHHRAFLKNAPARVFVGVG
jgi:hypothetical protein